MVLSLARHTFAKYACGEVETAGQQLLTDYAPTDVKSFWSGFECRKVQPQLSHSKMSVAVQSSRSVAIRLALVPPHSGQGRGGRGRSIVMESQECTVCANEFDFRTRGNQAKPA